MVGLRISFESLSQDRTLPSSKKTLRSQAENAIRNGAISTQAKMGLEAAKIGTKLTDMGVKAWL